jgi:hypothetical protein
MILDFNRRNELFDYLEPSIGPVVKGLEDHERICALGQMDNYIPLRTLPGEDGNSAIYRFELNAKQRQMVSKGADVLVEILHFGGPWAPSRAMLINEKGLSEEESKLICTWIAAQTKGPYRVKRK